MRDRRFSFEFFPPKTDAGRARFGNIIRELATLGPSFVSVTFGAGGSTREGSFQTASEIIKTTDLAVTPHLSCIGSTPEQIRAHLDMYRAIGVDRVMALRGDPPEGEPEAPRAFQYASDLVGFIRSQGGFRISVACYPEFHPESSTPDADVQAFVCKAKAGADDAIFKLAWSKALAHIEAATPEFLILQCGADSIAGDPITHLHFSPQAHAQAARDLCALADRLGHGRVLALGGGGYNRRNLALAWTAVVRELLSA